MVVIPFRQSTDKEPSQVNKLLSSLALTEVQWACSASFVHLSALNRMLLIDSEGQRFSLWDIKTKQLLLNFEFKTSELFVDNMVSRSGHWLVTAILDDYGNSQGMTVYVSYLGHAEPTQAHMLLDVLQGRIATSCELGFDEDENLWVDGLDYYPSVVRFGMSYYTLSLQAGAPMIERADSCPYTSKQTAAFHCYQLDPHPITLMRED